MKYRILLTCIVVAAVLLGVFLIIINQESNTDVKTESKIQIDVIMPTKVSRSGCEITDTCYIPSNITIQSGEKVSWQNQDSAFHSVTSGKYGSRTELFDSGHMDPDEIFTQQFTNPGIYDYHCTLHPWMAGQVVVE